jgi:hypothetical protein
MKLHVLLDDCEAVLKSLVSVLPMHFDLLEHSEDCASRVRTAAQPFVRHADAIGERKQRQRHLDVSDRWCVHCGIVHEVGNALCQPIN